MDFVAIDFETANSNRSSACALGIVEVRSGKIIAEHSWLINPVQSFDQINIQVHGITPAMVKGKPTFQQLWPTIEPLLQGKHVIAHNAAFDMSVLRYCLDHSSLLYPTFDYYCTYLLSKKLLPDLSSYKLNLLSEHFGIKLKHHDALDDARAAAAILLKLLEQEKQTGPSQLSHIYGYKVGRIHAEGYTPFSTSVSKSRKRQPVLSEPIVPAEPIIIAPIPALTVAETRTLGASNESMSGAKLIKGRKINISKNNESDQIRVELRWTSPHPDVEIDASAFLLDDIGRCRQDSDCIFYGNPTRKDGSVTYSKGDAGNAQLEIALDKLPQHTQKLAITLSIYEKSKQKYYFSQVTNMSLHLYHPQTGVELASFPFGEQLTQETAIVVGEIYLYRGDWKFNPIGSGFFGGLHALCRSFGLEVKQETLETSTSS